jgi:poly(A) polymerase/tRNA nucleotidyltransferase (CCA-adding enzyme)
VIHALLADPALQPILNALPSARIVGGAVRDALANRPVADIDLATPEPPDVFGPALERAGLRVLPTGAAHGTLTVLSDGRPFEVTTLRRDVETDGRHAVVAWTDDWRQDAARRDFTINAMSLDRAGTVHDYFGGQEDLRAGRVRFVGDAARRVAEDFLRILRFFRFFARYARGAPDPDAVAAIRAGVPGLQTLSAERVWSELKRILGAPDPLAAVLLMRDLGVMAAVLPEVTGWDRLSALLHAQAPADPLLRLAALIGQPAEIPALSERLRLSLAETASLEALAGQPVPLPEHTDIELRRLLADVPAETLIGRAWLQGGARPGWAALRLRLATLPRPVFPLEGRDALSLGAHPGPHIGRALRATRAWWLAGGCEAGAEACREQLRRQLFMTSQ